MKHVMVDLETLGTAPGCVILSVGAVEFDPVVGLGREFYGVIHTKSCTDAGLFIDPDTKAWWDKQNAEARKVLEQADDEESGAELSSVLEEFDAWLPKGALVWGNGADFDNPILSAAYKAIGSKQPWGSWNGRCYRTLKSMYPAIKMVREGTYHNALSDAISQAKHAVTIANAHNLVLA